MIKKLKLRMILLVLSGLFLASAGLVAVINWINWRSINSQVTGVLDMLSENDGQRPSWPLHDRFFEGDGPFEMGRMGDKDGQRFRGNNLQNAVSLSNYYTVELDAQGAVIAWQSDRAELYSDEDIAALAASALAQGKTAGRVGAQFYRLKQQGDCQLLIVVDARLEIQDAQRVLRLTALAAVIEDALLSLGAVFMIRRMVRPVDEAMEKQKQFVWDASHELKTPLAVISANAEALSGEIGASKPLEYIQSEVQRTDHLIQNLLTLARMGKGTLPLEPKRFDLSRTLLSVALPFESAVFEAGKTLDMRVPDGVSYTGNEEMIKQLCVILLSNAMKYSDEKGRITLSLESKGDKRLIRVHNTGPAIPPEAQKKIFDRFYRVDSSHNREIAGNGLGLSIAQEIVNAHKGKIAVSSAEGEGTTFMVTL